MLSEGHKTSALPLIDMLGSHLVHMLRLRLSPSVPLTGSVATARHFWMRASNVVFRTRCSSGMGFLVIFSVGMACRG